MSDKDGASKQLQMSAASAAGIELKEFENLSDDEKEKLEVIRQTLALDLLGYPNAQIERVLGMKKDSLYGMRGNHPGLWELAEKDFLRRMRELIGAVNKSIAEMISYGEVLALSRLEQIFKGGKRVFRFHGHPSFSLPVVEGDITPGIMVNACNSYMKHIQLMKDSILSVIGKEEAESRGLEVANDDYANKVREDKIATNKKKLVRKFKERRAEDSARSYANATADKSEKDLLPM